MAITIIPLSVPEIDVEIYEYEMELIKKIRHQIGLIAAIQVLRWRTKCGLRQAKEFCEKL